ncbi:SMP-30/gluconolactonase/LRE family protein [Planctomycetota bacterium]
MRVEKIVDCRCGCGEGPLWHAAEQRLYWVDIRPGKLFRYDPASGEHELVHQGRLLGGVIVQEDGSLLFLRDHGNVVCFRDDNTETIIEEIPDEPAFNDAIADPAGRVFSGTCAVGKPDHPGEYARHGNLHRIDPDGSHRVVQGEMIGSNGLGFSVDQGTLYFTDSTRAEIYAYEYSVDTGEIGNRRVFVSTKLPAIPDGMTVDAEDHVWSAYWDGGCVVRYAPDGAEVMRVDIPTSLTTSVMFGGPDLDELYVTSAGGENRDKNGPDAGALFRVTGLGVKGKPEFCSRIGL